MSYSILVAADWAPIRAFDPIVTDRPETIYGDLLPTLRDGRPAHRQLRVRADEGRHAVWKSGAVFKGAPEHVAGLTAVPFDVACLANNHVLDYGVRGLRDTLQVLHRNGIRTVGAGLTADDAYAPLTVDGQRATASTSSTSAKAKTRPRRGAAPGVFGWDIQRAVDTIERCKEDGGVVIVIAHCGLEYVPVRAALRRRRVPGAGRRRRGGGDRPPPARAAGRGMARADADHLQPRQLRVLPAHEPACTGRPGSSSPSQFDERPGRRTPTCIRTASPTRASATLDTREGDRVPPDAWRGSRSRTRRRRDPTRRGTRTWRTTATADSRRGVGHPGEDGTEPQKGAAMFRNRITTMQHTRTVADVTSAHALVESPRTVEAPALAEASRDRTPSPPAGCGRTDHSSRGTRPVRRRDRRTRSIASFRRLRPMCRRFLGARRHAPGSSAASAAASMIVLTSRR